MSTFFFDGFGSCRGSDLFGCFAFAGFTLNGELPFFLERGEGVIVEFSVDLLDVRQSGYC